MDEFPELERIRISNHGQCFDLFYIIFSWTFLKFRNWNAPKNAKKASKTDRKLCASIKRSCDLQKRWPMFVLVSVGSRFCDVICAQRYDIQDLHVCETRAAVAFHAGVLRGSSRVPAPLTSADLSGKKTNHRPIKDQSQQTSRSRKCTLDLEKFHA